MVQTEIFQEPSYYIDALQNSVNDFLKRLSNSRIIDIKYLTVGDSVTAMVVYEVYQDCKSDRPVSKGTLKDNIMLKGIPC